MLSRALARVQQHILDNGICALAVLNDLVEVVAQGVREFSYFSARLFISFYSVKGIPQLIDQFGRDTGEIVDKVEWVFDLVGDPSGQLAERGKLLCLNEAILRGPQVLQ